MNIKVYFCFLIVYCFPVEGIFLPPVLKSKLKRNNEAGQYEKMWMKYVEKRLETINLDLTKREFITSLLEIYEQKFRKKLFKNIATTCEQLGFKNPGGIQTSVHGKICGSSKIGKKQGTVDNCSKLSIGRAFCYKMWQKFPCKYP